MIHFSLDEKLFIAGACAASVLLFAIILACKISPYCCLYRSCSGRARYDELEGHDGSGKGKSKGKGKGSNYRLINYANLPPPMPSLTLTSLEKSNGAAATLTANGKSAAALPAYTATPNSGSVPIRLQHVRSHKESTSSVSGSSTASSDGAAVTGHREQVLQSASSGVGSTFSSDSGEGPIRQAPSLYLAIRYNESDEKLLMHIRGAVHVPTNIYGGANDSYVQILLVKDVKRRWRRKSNIAVDDLLQAISASRSSCSSVETSPRWTGPTYQAPYELAEFKTQLIRRQTDPVFNEHFAIDLKQKDKKHSFIKLILRSIDRFSHHSIVGVAHVSLANIGNGQDSLTTWPTLDEFSVLLQPYTPDLGEVLLSLCYLPTAERLHVNIMKITNMKPPAGANTANPFVKAMVIRRGKVLEKHNTPVQFHTLNPVFNEALIFDVPMAELEKVTLLLTVVHQDSSDLAEIPIFDDSLCRRVGGGGAGNFTNGGNGRRSSSTNGSAGRKRGGSMGNVIDAASEKTVPPMQKSRSTNAMRVKPCSPLGRLVFGSLAAVKESSRHHWQDMLRCPRKQVAQWHKLQP